MLQGVIMEKENTNKQISGIKKSLQNVAFWMDQPWDPPVQHWELLSITYDGTQCEKKRMYTCMCKQVTMLYSIKYIYINK